MTSRVPRPKGVTIVLFAWSVGAILATGQTLRVYLATGRVLPLLAGLSVASIMIAILLTSQSKW